ncbi:hypothetical protein VRRI112168_05175 [Vreelandella rituensis]|nr:hypothetical protein [Halomonas rituensis]
MPVNRVERKHKDIYGRLPSAGFQRMTQIVGDTSILMTTRTS